MSRSSLSSRGAGRRAVVVSLEFPDRVMEALWKLGGEVARRILRAIDASADDPRPAGCLQLSGGDGELRIRVGDYRVVYDVVDRELAILVPRLGRR